MKLLLLGILSIISFRNALPTEQIIDLDEALKRNLVTIEATGNEGSTHYLKPIMLKLFNRSNKKVVIRINAGYRFESNDSSVQDIVITQEELLALNPNKSYNASLSGMCVQHYNSAPSAQDAFSFAGYANTDLKKMARAIDSAKWQNCQAQQAMWLLSDGGELEDIYTFGDEQEWQILKTVAHISGKPLPDKKTFMADMAERHQIKAELKGVFKFKFSRKVPIHIALFDANGIVLQEIYRETANPGSHEVTYTFDALAYQGQTIYARFIARDEVLMTRVINL